MKTTFVRTTATGIIVVVFLYNLALQYFSTTTYFEHASHASRRHRRSPQVIPGLHELADFHWLTNTETICDRDPSFSKKLIFLIHSGREYTSDRNAIRNSWGSFKTHGEWTIHLIFLLGINDPKKNLPPESVRREDQLITQEHLQHRDIVQGSFVDSYRNLTYKTLMGYKWVVDYCPSADFVVKADDDHFIDVPRLLKLREEDLARKDGTNMHCITVTNPAPDRRFLSKWYVSKEEYPNATFPSHCSGVMYGMTTDLIERMYSVSSKVKYLSMEDVFTGMLLDRAKTEANGTLEIIQRDIWSEYETCMWDYCVEEHCNMEGEWVGSRNFGLLAKIPKDANFSRSMNCVWNVAKFENNVQPRMNSVNS